MVDVMPGASGADRRLFDAWSYVYDFPPVQRVAYRPVHDVIVAALRRFAPQRIVDIGCGTGNLVGRVCRELPASRVTGCDFSGGMLRTAAVSPSRIGWVQADAGALPFSDQAFDAVLCTEAFHWFPDQRAALAEFRRILEPRGRALIALVNPVSPILAELSRLGSRLLRAPLYWPTAARMREMVEAAGFSVASQRRVFRIPGFLLLPAVLTVAERP